MSTTLKYDFMGFIIQKETVKLKEQIRKQVEVTHSLAVASSRLFTGCFINNPKPIHDQLFEPEY